MNDIDTRTIPIPESQLEEWFKHVVPLQAHQAKRWRTVATDRRAMLIVSILLNVALVCALLSILPNVQYVPIIMYNGPSGMQFLSTTMSDLPPNVELAGIEARLWMYLHDREHYSASEADESYNIVSAMSDTTVREQYQHWANPKYFKESPASILGKDGWIRIFPLSRAFISHEGDYSRGVYKINYCKITYGGSGSTIRAQPFSAVIVYRLVRRIPLLQRITFNPEALIVTQYPGAEELAPPHDLNIGANNPCGITQS